MPLANSLTHDRAKSIDHCRKMDGNNMNTMRVIFLPHIFLPES